MSKENLPEEYPQPVKLEHLRDSDRGRKVLFIPKHVTDLSDPDVEEGEIKEWNTSGVFVSFVWGAALCAFDQLVFKP